MLKVVARIICSSVLGLFLCLWIIQNSLPIKNLVSSRIMSALEKEWHVKITVDSCDINFFTCSLYVNNARITPTDDKKYSWGFEQGRIYVSPFKYLFKNYIGLWITFNNASGMTRYSNGKTDLVDHIAAIFRPQISSVPIKTKSLSINNADLEVEVEQNASKNEHSPSRTTVYSLHMPGSFTMEKIKNHVRKDAHWGSSLSLTQATIARNKTVIAHSIAHTMALYMNKATQQWHGTAATTFKSCLLDYDKTYAIVGVWEPHEKKITVRDSQETLDVHAAYTDQNAYAIRGNAPVALLSQLGGFLYSGVCDQSAVASSLKGQCSADLEVSRRNDNIALSGSIEFSGIGYESMQLDKLCLSIKPNADSLLCATITATQESGTCFTGMGTYDGVKKRTEISIANTSKLTVPAIGSGAEYNPWVIEENALQWTFGIEGDGSVTGSYNVQVSNQITHKTSPYKGMIVLRNNSLVIEGTTQKGSYKVDAELSPSVHITNINYRIGSKDLIKMSSSEGNKFLVQGQVCWPFIRSFLDQEWRRFIFNNNCVFSLAIDQRSLDNLKISTSLAHGTFFIPDFHNLLTAVSVNLSINRLEKKATLDNAVILLSKGSIRCPCATIVLADDLSVQFLHAPLIVNNMFVNWKRDFLGFTSGNVLVNKTAHDPINISGSLVLKHSLLKDTFFGQEQSGAFYSSGGPIPSISLPLGFDIKVFTQKPLKAKTQSLETHAMIDLTFKHTPRKDFATAPLVKGTIDVQGGAVKFFHNKLHIEFGKIQFINGTTNDPLVELHAKNRIGKYLVQLQVTGSLQKPTILLESSPDLSEEQIIGLLLTGSESASLQADLPSMILQNLDTFIFGSKKNGRTAWFDKISKTFKYIQITPDLTNESSPAKLVGSISVNLNDQLRAHIQKSFDLEKDFSAHLEYALSDDINLKVIRDQRGELGSEVEMRFKLG